MESEGREVNEEDNGVVVPDEDDNMCDDVKERDLFMAEGMLGLVLESESPCIAVGRSNRSSDGSGFDEIVVETDVFPIGRRHPVIFLTTFIMVSFFFSP